MINFKLSVFLSAFTWLFISCEDGPKTIQKPLELLEDSLLILPDTNQLDSATVDSIWHVFPSFDTTALHIDTNSLIQHSLDSLYDSMAESVDFSSNTDSNKQIVGKWMVHQKVSKDMVLEGGKKVFAVYHQDSIFSMKAINILGKWWIKDSLLFQKFELPTKLTIDTSEIHVLNDSILEVSEYRGGNKYIFVKVAE